MIGSVHLAWHYAVDGIAGAGLAIALWYLAGLIVRGQRPLPHAPRAVTVPVGASAPVGD
jgi:hypothetical protein